MTVQAASNKVNYTGNGVITVFSYLFRVDDATWMKVYLDNVLQSTGYTVDLNAKTVTFATAPASGVTITLLREVPLNQEIDYTEYDPFPAETHEGGLDKGIMIDQQISEQLGRGISAPPSDDGTTDFTLPDYDAGKGIMWHPTEKRMKNSQDNFDTLVDDATTQANNAATSASQSASSASASAASASKANEWAEKPEDQEVEPGQYSALHWAAKAATFNPGDYVRVDGTVPMTGDLTIQKNTPFLNFRSLNNDNPTLYGYNSSGIIRANMYMDVTGGRIGLQTRDAAGVSSGLVTVENDGNIRTGAAAPNNAADLTRKDYVDSLAPTALGQITSTGAVGAGSVNIASATPAATGQYNVVFTTPMATTNYMVVGSIFGINARIFSTANKTVNGFLVYTYDNTNTAQALAFDFVVYGGQ